MVAFIKNTIRKYIYPPYNFLTTIWLSRIYASKDFSPDFWLWGQRGSDYARLRKRVDDVMKISQSSILIAGCGAGRDVPSWLKYRPKKIIGLDLYNHDEAWQSIKNIAGVVSPSTKIDFMQGNLENLTNIESNSLDIISSDAVFEHLKNFPQVLREFKRVLRPNGILYATFGPLWFTWGGDHYSGHEDSNSGYNHLLLSQLEYVKYLNIDEKKEYSEDDGRIWIKEGLFSYLRPLEYITILEEVGYRKVRWGAIVDPRAVSFSRKNPNIWDSLLKRHGEHDLLITGMTIIYRNHK